MKKSADFKRITHSGSTQVDARDAFHMLQMLERSLQDIETRMSRAVGDIEKQLTGLELRMSDDSGTLKKTSCDIERELIQLSDRLDILEDRKAA